MHLLLKKTITHFGFSLLENDVIEVEVAEVIFSLQRIFALSFFLSAIAFRRLSGSPRSLPAFFLLSDKDLAQSG